MVVRIGRSILFFLFVLLSVNTSIYAQTGEYWVVREHSTVSYYGATALAAAELFCIDNRDRFIRRCQDSASCNADFVEANDFRTPGGFPFTDTLTFSCDWFLTYNIDGVDDQERATGGIANLRQYDCSMLRNGEFSFESGQCFETPTPSKNSGCHSSNENLSKNPCNIATGNKFRSEIDYRNSNFSFVRSYNSDTLVDVGVGIGWRHNFQKELMVSDDSLTQVSTTGRGEPWLKVEGIWTGLADTDLLIGESDNGFELIKPNSAKENYNLMGKVVSEIDTNGQSTTYNYGFDGELLKVINHYGHSITFAYDDQKVASIRDAFGSVYQYEYDDNRNLISVIYPDATPNDDSDNPRKIYHYENEDFPNHLTGITDENGDRYGNFAYDEDGKAVLSELGVTSSSVGQEKIELDYQGAN